MAMRVAMSSATPASGLKLIDFNGDGRRDLIEEDLDRADSKAEEASDGLAQAAVRQEIQETLEKYYDWSW